LNYKYRMHDPRLGRFFAVDPLTSKYPWNSTYAFSENRVVDKVELEGLEADDAELTDAQQAVVNKVFTAAKSMKAIYYVLLREYMTNVPKRILISSQIQLIKTQAYMAVNQDMKTATWQHLGMMWFFELGDEDIEIGEDALTTRLLVHEAPVNDARDKVYRSIIANPTAVSGDVDIKFEFTKGYVLNEWLNEESDEYMNPATAFLGTYSGKISWTKTEDNVYTLNFSLLNVSGWASATRYLPAPAGTTTHASIIPNRKRLSPGIQLGGNFTQRWKWDESYKLLENGEFETIEDE